MMTQFLLFLLRLAITIMNSDPRRRPKRFQGGGRCASRTAESSRVFVDCGAFLYIHSCVMYDRINTFFIFGSAGVGAVRCPGGGAVAPLFLSSRFSRPSARSSFLFGRCSRASGRSSRRRGFGFCRGFSSPVRLVALAWSVF